MNETYGYCFQVIGQGQNGVDTSYGLLFATSEAEARGYAVSYFRENNPRASMLDVKVKQVVLRLPVVIENNMLVSRDVK